MAGVAGFNDYVRFQNTGTVWGEREPNPDWAVADLPKVQLIRASDHPNDVYRTKTIGDLGRHFPRQLAAGTKHDAHLNAGKGYLRAPYIAHEH